MTGYLSIMQIDEVTKKIHSSVFGSVCIRVFKFVDHGDRWCPNNDNKERESDRQR